jgi:hypothetical protein
MLRGKLILRHLTFVSNFGNESLERAEIMVDMPRPGANLDYKNASDFGRKL